MQEGRAEAVDLLDVGERRFDLLALLADGPVSKPALVDDLDVSRSTVNRALRELEEWHLVARTEGKHVLTPAGRLLTAALDEYLTDLATLAEASRVLAHLPVEVEVPLEFLRDAEVIHATPPSSTRVLRRVSNSLRHATRSRCLIGELASETGAEFFRDQIEDGLDFEVVFDDHMLSFLLAERREELQVYADEADVYTTDRIPYSLLITEEGDGTVECHFVVYDDEGNLAGLLVNDTPDAVAWAEGLFERVRDDATSLDLG